MRKTNLYKRQTKIKTKGRRHELWYDEHSWCTNNKYMMLSGILEIFV